MMSENVFSYWEQETFLAGYDIIIIGSGIVGLSAAIELKKSKQNLSIAILERGLLPSGASTKNAGFACFGSVSELLENLRTSSLDDLLLTVEKRWRGLRNLRNMLGDNAIDYQPNGGYEIFKSDESLFADECLSALPFLNKSLKEIIQAPDIYSVATDKIADFGFANVDAMILNKYEGQIDTGKMMKALTQKAISSGIMIFSNTEVVQILNGEPQLRIKTANGTFKCHKVLLCNNAFATRFLPETDIVPGRGQVLVTAPIKNLKFKGTFHYDKGYYYFRNIGNRILVGGGRNIDFYKEQTTEFGLTETVQEALEDLLGTVIIPQKYPVIEYRWSGIMAFGKSIHPKIEKLEDNVFCAVKCNGMGIAQGTLNGAAAAAMILSDSNI